MLFDILFDTENLKSGFTKITVDVNDAGDDANNKVSLSAGSFKMSVRSNVTSENRLRIFSFDGSFEQQISWWKKYTSATMKLGFLVDGCDEAVRYVWSTDSGRVHIDQKGNITNTGSFARTAVITLTAYDADGNVVASSAITVRFYKFNWQYKRLQSQEVISDNIFKSSVEPTETESERIVSLITAFFSKVFHFFTQSWISI